MTCLSYDLAVDDVYCIVQVQFYRYTSAVSFHAALIALSYIITTSMCKQSHKPMHVQRQADDADPGYVSISSGLFATGLWMHVEDMKDHYCRIALLCAFAFLNILTPIVLAKSLSWYYPRVRAVASGRHFTACLYNGTSWLDTYCDVSVSESEEKSLLQCKTLWTYICTLHCDYFNRGTYFQPTMG